MTWDGFRHLIVERERERLVLVHVIRVYIEFFFLFGLG